jgi:hypothetical protein
MAGSDCSQNQTIFPTLDAQLNAAPRSNSVLARLMQIENCYCTTRATVADDRAEPLVPVTVIP